MGWLDNLKAAATVASKAAQDLLEEAGQELESEFGDSDWYQGLKEVGAEAADMASDVAAGVAEVSRDAVAALAETEIGQSAGHGTRAVAGYLSNLPVLSVVTDSLRLKHGVDPLYQHLLEDTSDPIRFVWLAEALDRMSRDRSRYTAARSVVDPTYLVAKTAIQSAAALGAEEDPARIRLLKNAFILSLQRLRSDPTDTPALHAISRVYRAQGELGEATRFGKLAILSSPEDGQLWTNLAKVYWDLEQSDNAERAARNGLDRQCTVGNEVLADLYLERNSSGAAEVVEMYCRLRDDVRDSDRIRFYGPGVEQVNFLESLGEQQLQRTKDLFSAILR